jgi:hypothetical protein
MEWAKLGEPVAQPFRYQQEHCAAFHLHNHIAAAAALHNYLIKSPHMAAKICITAAIHQLASKPPCMIFREGLHKTTKSSAVLD